VIYFPKQARVDEPKAEQKAILLQGFPQGINTAIPSFQLNEKEMASCINLKIVGEGRLESRKPFTVYTTSAISGYPVALELVTLAGVPRTIVGGSDYKVYYLDGTTPTLIGTAAGVPYLVSYNDVCLVCDGSYLKYISSTAALKIAYDAGTYGTMFDNYSGENSSGLAIGDGTNSKAGVKFTTPAWDAGYTMPTTQITAFLKRVGATAGAVWASVTRVSTGTVVASVVKENFAETVSTDGEFVDFYFTAADVTTELLPNTEYYASISHSPYAGGTYLEVRCSLSTLHESAYVYTGSWAAVAHLSPIMRVHPGLPPKAAFGWVSKTRPWLAGDPDNPGYVWYGNLTHLDFSTPDGGGYVGVVDESKNSFVVGAGGDLYGDMFVYGTEKQPYLCQLTGDNPTNFALPHKFQRAWATQRTLKNVGNDLWNSSSTGVDSLSGVQQYGDVRSTSISDRVKNKFTNYWATDLAFAGYYPEDGQYWLSFKHATYSKILVGHARRPFSDEGLTAYPWTEYTVPFTPTVFGSSTIGFMIGASNGYLYKVNPAKYLDLGTTNINASFKTPYIELPFKSVDLVQLQAMFSSTAGSTATIRIYKNGGQLTPVYTKTFTCATSDMIVFDSTTFTIDDLTFPIADWSGTIASTGTKTFFDSNINVNSVQIEFYNIQVGSFPVYINGCILNYRVLKGL